MWEGTRNKITALNIMRCCSCSYWCLLGFKTFVEEPQPHGNSEVVWIKLSLNKSKHIYVCFTTYRPPGSLTEPLIDTSYEKSSVLHAAILLAGNFTCKA